jgi:rhodanese-related sulfurtransferase
MKTLDTAELTRMRRKNPRGFLLVNVLAPEAFEKAHIPDSVNIPESSEDFVKRVRDRVQKPDDTVVVYCASRECNASPKAARKLEEAGFTDVYDYETGMAGWVRADKPVAPVQ